MIALEEKQSKEPTHIWRMMLLPAKRATNRPVDGAPSITNNDTTGRSKISKRGHLFAVPCIPFHEYIHIIHRSMFPAPGETAG